MKKMKKMFAIVLGTLLALIPVMSISIVSFAATKINGVIEWYDRDTKEYFSTTSCVLSVAEDSGDYSYHGVRREADENSYWYYVAVIDWEDYFEPGDTVTFYLPFAIDESKVIDYKASGAWSYELVSPTCVVATNLILDDRPWINVRLPKPASSTEDQFWFKPMKTQLAVAADIVATNGGTAVAEASGDFGLSYEIMKYLDDHPGVTLKYTLTYKGEEHLIVIPGGGKFANPEIPWYGAEYLIGNFGK